MEADARYSRWLWIILLVGLLLRLVYAMDQPTVSAFEDTGGGDSGWFLAVGWGFFSGQEHGWIRRIPFTNAQIPTPPVYIVFAGISSDSLAIMQLLSRCASYSALLLWRRLILSIALGRFSRVSERAWRAQPWQHFTPL